MIWGIFKIRQSDIVIILRMSEIINRIPLFSNIFSCTAQKTSRATEVNLKINLAPLADGTAKSVFSWWLQVGIRKLQSPSWHDIRPWQRYSLTNFGKGTKFLVAVMSNFCFRFLCQPLNIIRGQSQKGIQLSIRFTCNKKHPT